MNNLTRRSFAASATLLTAATIIRAEDPKDNKPQVPERDYPAPQFQPKFSKPQLSKLLVQDFVIFAHSDLEMTKRLQEKEPALVNAFMDWGAGDWESGLGGASHMGRRDIAEFLLNHGARIDIFCAAMLGQLETIKQLLANYPKLIDAKGPHGISLHLHAKFGGKEAKDVLDYLQSVKYVDLSPKKAEKPPEKK